MISKIQAHCTHILSFQALTPYLCKYKHIIHNCSFIPRAFVIAFDNT